MTKEEALEWAGASEDRKVSILTGDSDCMKTLARIVREQDAEIARLQEERDKEDTCMCGSRYADHANGAQGHEFVSMYWYTLDKERERAEAAEKERDELRAKLKAAEEVIQAIPAGWTAIYDAIAKYEQEVK